MNPGAAEKSKPCGSRATAFAGDLCLPHRRSRRYRDDDRSLPETRLRTNSGMMTEMMRIVA